MPDSTEGFIIESDALADLIKAAVARGSSISFRARGTSMAPFIKQDDIITVSLPDSGPSIGDVAVFLHPVTKALTVHRIIRNSVTGLKMKGDNRSKDDGEIAADALLGKVTAVKRGGKQIKIGLSREKLLIAFLSRINFLVPLIRIARVFLLR
jgi:hypothetical protein